MNNKILLVDDDPDILSAYRRNLHKKFHLFSAQSADEGLKILKESGPFSAIVSDYRMPGMDGIQFLALSRSLFPDTVRIMLTGQADMQAAIDAINQGNIFRFLNKPCPSELLVEHLHTAVEQYRLVNAERELLEQTLKGSVKVLVDILGIVNPLAFSKAEKFRVMSRKIAERMQIQDTWEIELTAMLSQIGCVTVPEEILKKKLHNQPLTPTEEDIFASHPQLGQKLLMNIPRLDGIANAIANQFAINNKDMKNTSLSANIITMLNDFDQLSQNGSSMSQALSIMQNQRDYAPMIMSAFQSETISAWGCNLAEVDFKDLDFSSTSNTQTRQSKVQVLNMSEIKVGMVLDENIIDKEGRVLITHPHVITDVLRLRLQNFARLGLIRNSVRVQLEATEI
ncbi:MAG: response regulator [Syntrophomonadaceae bacterium]|nr:response regulator [Syntrophomonadaceae bacterium]MDD3022385.1 response regulator [Syntrophomonadaceae bacterium]